MQGSRVSSLAQTGFTALVKGCSSSVGLLSMLKPNSFPEKPGQVVNFLPRGDK